MNCGFEWIWKYKIGVWPIWINRFGLFILMCDGTTDQLTEGQTWPTTDVQWCTWKSFKDRVWSTVPIVLLWVFGWRIGSCLNVSMSYSTQGWISLVCRALELVWGSRIGLSKRLEEIQIWIGGVVRLIWMIWFFCLGWLVWGQWLANFRPRNCQIRVGFFKTWKILVEVLEGIFQAWEGFFRLCRALLSTGSLRELTESLRGLILCQFGLDRGLKGLTVGPTEGYIDGHKKIHRYRCPKKLRRRKIK